MGTRRQLTVEDVRTYMRDVLPRNDLLLRVQFSDAEIIHATELTVDRFNAMTPLLSHDYSVRGFPNRFILLKGTTASLLNGEAMANIRNQLSYSDGGISVGVDDKFAQYLQLAQTEMAEFERYTEDYKKQLNADQAFGGLDSGYSALPWD